MKNQATQTTQATQATRKLHVNDMVMLINTLANLEAFKLKSSKAEVIPKARKNVLSLVADLHTLNESELIQAWVRLRSITQAESALITGDTRVGYTLVPGAIGVLALQVAAMLGCIARNDPESAAMYANAAEISLSSIPEDVQDRWNLRNLVRPMQIH